MKKNILATLLACCLSAVLLISCSRDNSKPEYLLKGARDNGFVPAYRAYYTIENDTVKKISRSKYEKYIYGNNKSKYNYLPITLYSFDVYTGGIEPRTWKYEQSKYDDNNYDIETLKNYLVAMGVEYDILPSSIHQDSVDILVTEFDDYTIVEANHLRDHTILDSKYALFHNGEMITNSFDLSDIRCVYKRN